MFCPNCGKSADAGVKFCPSCGSQINGSGFTGAGFPPPQAPFEAKLVRPRHSRMIAGVCAGFAIRYGWDLSVVRIVTVALACLSGFGVLCYLAAWVIIPDASWALPAESAYSPAGDPASGSAGNHTV